MMLSDEIFAVGLKDVILPEAMKIQDHWRLIRRLKLPNQLNEPTGPPIRRAIVLDVETTGLDIKADEVVQLAMLPFTYEADTGAIIDIEHARAFNGFREPSAPLSDEAAAINGLDATRLAGQIIEASQVENAIADADLIIAHNAKFDRCMVEKLWPIFASKPWACTYSEIKWQSEGFLGSKLELIGLQYGWFYDAHDALADCEACVAILAQNLPRSGRKVLHALLEAVQIEDYLVVACGAAYSQKEALKARGYKWRATGEFNPKVWHTRTNDLQGELAWLKSEIYGNEDRGKYNKINALNRHTHRLWEF